MILFSWLNNSSFYIITNTSYQFIFKNFLQIKYFAFIDYFNYMQSFKALIICVELSLYITPSINFRSVDKLLQFLRIAFIFIWNNTLTQSHNFWVISHFMFYIRKHYISQQCVAAHKYWNELTRCTIVQKSQCSLIYDSLCFFIHIMGVYS